VIDVVETDDDHPSICRTKDLDGDDIHLCGKCYDKRKELLKEFMEEIKDARS